MSEVNDRAAACWSPAFRPMPLRIGVADARTAYCKGTAARFSMSSSPGCSEAEHGVRTASGLNRSAIRQCCLHVHSALACRAAVDIFVGIYPGFARSSLTRGYSWRTALRFLYRRMRGATGPNPINSQSLTALAFRQNY